MVPRKFVGKMVANNPNKVVCVLQLSNTGMRIRSRQNAEQQMVRLPFSIFAIRARDAFSSAHTGKVCGGFSNKRRRRDGATVEQLKPSPDLAFAV
jgi:hypothetical protein